MAKNKKQYDDDDGRIIADMSGVERNPLVVPRFGGHSKKNEAEPKTDDENKTEYQMSGEERRAFIGGAVSAALAIASVFIIAGGILIFLITRIN